MATPLPSQRRRRHRSSSVVVTTVAASAAVAYGAYRLAQWYWKEDDDDDDDDDRNERKESDHSATLQPLQEDLLSGGPLFASNSATASPPQSTTISSSWLSVATDWLVDATTTSSSMSSSATIAMQNPRGSSMTPTTVRSSTPVTGRTRRQRLMHCRQKTLTAFCACFPALQPILEELTSTSKATRQLKELRKQQKELNLVGGETELTEGEQKQLQRQQDDLWKLIVVENTTRMMASSYAYTLLFLSLTVQLHWISGNREKLLQESFGAQTSSTEIAQAMLMKSHQYLVEMGIPLLVSTIRRSVEAVVAENTGVDWTKPTQFLTEQDIEQLLYHQLPQVLRYGSIHTRDSNATARPAIQRNWMRFILPDEEPFDPVWDICSSPVWNDAQEQVLQTLWYKLLRDDDADGWKRLFEQTSEAEQQAAVALHQKPVAKVVAQLKKSSNLLFAEVVPKESGIALEASAVKGPSILNSLQKLPTVLELGDKIYYSNARNVRIDSEGGIDDFFFEADKKNRLDGDAIDKAKATMSKKKEASYQMEAQQGSATALPRHHG
ncbi:hypothetical protein IV203_034707 [Nitzschia inconspicua]|uniref:Peroxin-3 n=1 Tax=Nitzschia inconspicua TaxID=303405 RepID=A0A9K3PWE8_9STRA|nr:hypothetical protein IV203_034707 [Nitzschia inconspicua]